MYNVLELFYKGTEEQREADGEGRDKFIVTKVNPNGFAGKKDKTRWGVYIHGSYEDIDDALTLLGLVCPNPELVYPYPDAMEHITKISTLIFCSENKKHFRSKFKNRLVK